MTTTGIMWLIMIAIFVALFVFWRQWRAFTVCLVATMLLSVFAPVIGAALTLPILGLGLVASICCLIADDNKRAKFEDKFDETIAEANKIEEKKNEEEQ